MSRKQAEVVCLHAYRELKDHPEKELQKLLWRVLEEKHQGDILAASEAYAIERAGQVTLQLLSKGVVDRDELYDAMIAWCLQELEDNTTEVA